MSKRNTDSIVFRRFSWHELQKHLRLIRTTFGTDSDPDQIPPDREHIRLVLQLSRRCLLYADEQNGSPVGEAFAFPTTAKLQKLFLAGGITERELLQRTPANRSDYEAIYACAVLVKPKWQRKGLGSVMIQKVLTDLFAQYPKASVFCWSTTKEGRKLVASLSRKMGITIQDRSRLL